MIIDIANQYAIRIDYNSDNKLVESIFIFAPDNDTVNRVKNRYQEEGFSREIEDIIQQDEMEVSYIQLNWNDNSVQAFRSITSHYELFYYKNYKNDFFITDHMINMISYLPISERRLCLDGICDMFLYQHNYGKETYLKNIYRLQYGEKLVFQNNNVYLKNVQLLQLKKYDLKKENSIDVLEESLRYACLKMKKQESLNTLSGGIDSTLTHMIMENPISVSGSYDVENFLCEKQYAKEAADILHANHTIYDIAMKDYMKYMVRVVRHYGLSAYNMTTQIIHDVLADKTTAKHMVISELADAVCGLKLRKPYDNKDKKYTIEDKNNYANRNSMIARELDINNIIKIFGESLVKKRLENRNQYVLSKLSNLNIEDTEKDNLLQYAHLIDYYTNNGVESIEQIEMFYGKTINSLYCSRQVLEKFLSIEIQDRYYNKEYGYKPYAKRLLERLLPAYDVKKQKLGGSLPRTWMVTEGPMAGYFRKHEIPDFVDKSLYNSILEPTWETSWCVKYLIMYSVWYEHVMCQKVKKIPSKFQIHLEMEK